MTNTSQGAETSEGRAEVIGLARLIRAPATVVDRAGRLVWFNAASSALTDWTEAEANGQVVWELLSPAEERDEVRALFGRVASEGIALTHLHHWQTKSGGRRLLSWHLSPLGEQGKAGDVLAVGVDLTGRAGIESGADLALEARLRAILHALPDLLFRIRVDGTILEFYAPNQGELAVPPDKILGHTLQELLPADIAEASIATAKQALQSGQVATHEYALDLAGGRQYFEARHVASGPNETLAIVRNITQRKRDEKALRRSVESFRTLIERSPDLIVVHRQGKIVYVNQRCVTLLGYDSPDELVGSPALTLVHPDDREIAAERIRRMAASGAPAPAIEERIMRRDGTTVTAEVAAIPLEFHGEEAIIVVAHDVTARLQAEKERRALEERVQHAQKLESLGVLAGGIAHDFNNLLMGVLGNADLALAQLPKESPARESLVRIEAAGRRAADLTRQMLAYSGKGKFIVEPIDLSRLVDEMIHLLRTIVSKRASFRLDLATGLPLVDADASQVSQVVMNLITNASDAIGQANGVISIATGTQQVTSEYLAATFTSERLPPGEYVYLEVSDTGCGMDDATLGKIFDPFFTTKFTGRGLGLAAVLGIVRGHRGAVKVYSEPGLGTTFKVLLPVSESSPTARRTPTPTPSPVVGSCTVLVVDDDDIARTLAAELLEHFGFKVVMAGDGAEAVRTLREDPSRIDLVLLDMTMPVMNGAETFRELRQVRSDIRVVLTSGYNEQDAISRFSGKGLAGFIQKPYSPDDLVAKLRSVLGR